MVDFICDGGHRFHYPAKKIIIDPDFLEQVSKLKDGQFLSRPTEASGYEPRLEVSCCPFCQSKTFSEMQEADVANVLVVELTTGPQIAIDKALADGYKVVGRYAKQYVLEKPKEVKTE